MPGEYPGDGEKNGMTLLARHRIRNSRPGVLRSSTRSLVKNATLNFDDFAGEQRFVTLEPEYQSRGEPATSGETGAQNQPWRK